MLHARSFNDVCIFPLYASVVNGCEILGVADCVRGMVKGDNKISIL